MKHTGNNENEYDRAMKKQKRKKILITIGVIAVIFIVFLIILNVAIKAEKRNWISNKYKGDVKQITCDNLNISVPKGMTKTAEDEDDDGHTVGYSLDSNESDVLTIDVVHLYRENNKDFNQIYKQKVRTEDVSDDVEDHTLSGDNYKAKYISYIYTSDEDADDFSYYDSLVKVDDSYFLINATVRKSYEYDNLMKDIYDHADFKDFVTEKLKNISVGKYEGDASPGETAEDILDDTKVMATYSNGDTKDVSDDCQISGEKLEPDTTRQYEITYTDKEYKKDYTVKLTVPCSVQVNSLQAKYTGSTKKGVPVNSSAKGLKVTAVLKDGKKVKLKKGDYKVENPSKLKAGQTSNYTISYGKAKTNLSITCTSMSPAQKVQRYKDSCNEYSYSNLAHYPDRYEGKRIRVSGKVLQVMDGSYRLAMNGDYDTVVYIDDWSYIYNSGNTTGKQIIEDDYITVYGECDGTQSYTTVLGADVTIPLITAHYIVN